MTKDNVIKRHVCNFENGTYFGYDLTVEPAADGRVRLRFAPLSMTPKEMTQLFSKVAKWTPLELPNGSATMEVRVGETVALDLFHNHATGQKVTDYLTVKGSRSGEAKVSEAPRELAAEKVAMEIRSPTITVDGQELVSSKAAVSGEAVWIDLPQHGRFVFSLAPRPDLGLQNNGEIRGSKMTWRGNSREYALTSSKAIAPGSRPYKLYVLPIPRPVDDFALFAGSRIEDVTRKK